MKIIQVFCVFVCSIVLVNSVHDDNDYDRFMHPHFRPIVSNKYKSQLKNEESADYWKEIGRNITLKHKESFLNMNTAKNVILFLGDGMSIPTLAAARAYIGQKEGKTGEEYELTFDKFPISGLSKTYCVDTQVADSACSATAYLTGVKANYETIGVTAAVTLNDCEKMQNKEFHTTSIAEWFMDAGRSAGVVTTARVTHASPAGTYANTANRDWESDTMVMQDGADPKLCPDIAEQLVHQNPANKFQVILGGGRRNFLPSETVDEEGQRGSRSDHRNLIDEWKELKSNNGEKHEYVWNRSDLLSVDDDTEYLLGLFEGSHCRYYLDADPELEPTLTEMTEAAIKILSKNPNGYFLFVEGARIDMGHHENRARYALEETSEFSKAIARAVELTSNEDTLIVVTADHAHAMTLNGYPSRGNSILDKVDTEEGKDGIPYLTLSYANGPGYRKEVDGQRVDVTKEDMENLSFLNPAMVPLNSETHGGDDVGVFAFGPQQHLFSGVYEQNAIPHIMAYAACIYEDFSACADKNKK